VAKTGGVSMAETVQRRKNSLRLEGYDYTQAGAYFITTTTHGRNPVFGKIENDVIALSPAGKIVKRVWLDLPRSYSRVNLDSFCIMPDHFHGIITLLPAKNISLSNSKDALDGTVFLSEIMRAFKSFTSRQINACLHTPGTTVWQRGFYEHIIRTESDLDRIRTYINNNTLKWVLEQENS
jgi:putative transposase